MEQKNSSFINIKNKLWIWLLIESILLSACGENSSQSEPEIIIEEIIEAEQNDMNNLVEIQPYQESGYDEYGNQYSVVETEDGEFEVTLYDKENNVIHTERLPLLPWVMEVTDNILQIGMTGGNISALIFYFDKERAIVSPFYTESFYLKDNYVAYMKNESTLVLTDIFEDGELYMEVNRNFSDSQQLGGTRLSIKDITMIKLNGRDVVVLEYYEGEDRELISEIIPLDEKGEAIVFDELEEIEREYEILEYDICSPVLYDFEDVNQVVKKHIEYEVSNHVEISQKFGRELKIEIDYHLFDFDDDGLDDYLLCIDRELHDGRMEHWIEIYVSKKERGWIGSEHEMVEEMGYSRLELNLPLGSLLDENEHKQIMILDEQIDEYYTIVLPVSNLILRYDDQNNEYKFCDQ